MFSFLHRIVCQDVSAYSFGSWCVDGLSCLVGRTDKRYYEKGKYGTY
jgi:hypothetical protein